MDRYAANVGHQVAWLDAHDMRKEANRVQEAWNRYTRQFPHNAQVAVSYVRAYTSTRDLLRRRMG